MILTVDAKRRITLPAALAETKPGERFEARFDVEEDALIFRRLPAQEDWLTVLKECPVAMDDVPPRRKALPKKRKL